MKNKKMLKKVKHSMSVKIVLSLTFLVFGFAQNIFGQNIDAEIKNEWIKLDTLLKTRAILLQEFTAELLAKAVPDKKINLKANNLASQLVGYLDSTNKDIAPKSVKIIYQKNEDLTTSFAKAVVTLENFGENKTVMQLLEMLPQIEGLENSITIAKNIYNEKCKSKNKLDLLFVNPKPEIDIKLQF